MSCGVVFSVPSGETTVQKVEKDKDRDFTAALGENVIFECFINRTLSQSITGTNKKWPTYPGLCPASTLLKKVEVF